MTRSADDRSHILNDLLNGQRNPADALVALSAFSWDSDDEIVELTLDHLTLVLQRYMAGEIDDELLIAWAEAVSGRDDIAYDRAHHALVSDVLFQLSTPEIFGPIEQLAADARTRVQAAGS